MTKKELNDLKVTRAQSELTMCILKLLVGFKSKEEPTITLTNKDKVEVLLKVSAAKVRCLK